MKFGESVQVAEGMALGAKWRAEMRGFDNGDAGRVVVFVEGEGLDLVHMDEHLEYEDFITMADEIVQALVEALVADRVDLTAARARLAELEAASVTARGAQVDELRRVLGCSPGETMLEAAKRLTRDLDDYRKAAQVEASLGDEARAEVKRLRAEVDGRVLAAIERAPVDLEPLPPELEACLDERIEDARRSAFDVTAEKAGPLPTVVLAQTEAPLRARDTIIAELGLPSVESIIERVESALGPAEYYDCGDSERLTHEDVSEAIWGYLDDVMWHTSPGDGPPEVAVRAYERNAIADQEYASEALNAAADIIENLDAEYGGDEARDEVEAAEKALATELESLIRKHYPQSLVWRCSQVGKGCDLTEKECWSLVLDHCCDDELAEWAEAAKAWLSSPEVVADAERAERQRRAEEGRESVPEPYGSVVGEWDVPPVHEPEKPGSVRHTTVDGVGCVGRLRRA